MRNSGTSSPVEPVRYLSADEVVAMHERLLDRFGGTPGLSDPGVLESALFRPQTGSYPLPPREYTEIEVCRSLLAGERSAKRR